MIVRNVKELKNHLNKILIDAMDKVGETALKHMIDYVDKEMQRRVSFQSGLYDRTYQYLQSIKKISANYNPSNGYVEVIIGYFSDDIQPYIQYPDTGLWNKHADIYGNSMADFIPLFLEEGTSTLGNKNFYAHEPVEGLVNLEEWVELNFRNELKKELNKLGIRTK